MLEHYCGVFEESAFPSRLNDVSHLPVILRGGEQGLLWVTLSRSDVSMNVGITPLKRTKLFDPGSAKISPSVASS